LQVAEAGRSDFRLFERHCPGAEAPGGAAKGRAGARAANFSLC